MNIELAEVKDNTDFLEQGTIYVTNKSKELPFKVNYVSPYLAGKNGGFVAIPEIGARILICKPDNDNNWYYLGSIMAAGLGASLSDSSSTLKDKGLNPDKKMYKARGVPQRYIFKSPKGNALILSDEYSPDYFNIKTELRTPSGKSIKLIDSPKVDCIIIENEHGDKFKLSSKANDSTAARSIELDCQGPINIITRGSTLNLQVVDGKELNIVNTSTGSKRANANDPTPGVINITSENNDVNLTVKSDTGSIFLDSQGQNGHIVIKSKGDVTIDGEKGVTINSNSGNVDVTGTQINLN